MVTLYDPDLDKFCSKYLVQGRSHSSIEIAQFPVAMENQCDILFENLMLFEKLSWRIRGENIILSILLNNLGISGIEALLESGALRFELWTSDVFCLNDELVGVDPLAFGSFTSEAHSDPLKSADLGLNWSRFVPAGRRRQKLIQKCADAYHSPDKVITQQAVTISMNAYWSGRFIDLGLVPDEASPDKIAKPKRNQLAKCASDYVEFTYLSQQKLSSYGGETQANFLRETADRIEKAESITQAYEEIRTVERVPNLRALRRTIPNALKRVVTLRSKKNATHFRRWLSERGHGDAHTSVISDYIDALAERRGIFDSAPAKFAKSLVMAGIGTAGGLAVGAGLEAAAVGATVGAAATRLLEPFLTEVTLDLADAFILDGAARGWSPRLFFDDLRKVSAQTRAPSGSASR